MAQSQVKIVNRALTKLKAQRITSINDGTHNANEAAAVWDDVLDEVLASFPWNFATRRVMLSALSSAPVYGYDLQYRLPVEPKCLAVWEAISDSEVPIKAYVIEGDSEGGLLLTNYSVIYIKYTARIIDPERFSPWFVECLATRLGAELSYAITGKRDKDLYQEYLFKLQIAGMKEGQQGEDVVQDDNKYPLEDDWVGCRD